MTNQMLVFGGDHNGINCIQKTDAKRSCDKIWFTVKQIQEWSGMTNRTLYNRLNELEECGRITSLQDSAKTLIPDSLGVLHESTIYNLNVLNQLAMVEMKNKVLNETTKKFSDILSEVETTGSYGITQISRKDQLYLALIHADSEVIRADALKELEEINKQEVKAITEERDEAIRTKAHISDKKTATALGKVGGLTKQNNLLKDNLYGNRNYRTIRAVASANHLKDKDISWRRLKAYCETNGLELKKVQDEKFGTLYSYPIEAFNAVYPELTIK